MAFDLEAQLHFLDELAHRFKSEWDHIPLEADEGFYIYNNWIGPVDSEILYAMVRRFTPKEVIEIGSGMSTRCINLALETNKIPFGLTAIDPEPRHPLDVRKGIKFIRKKVEDVPLRMFSRLEKDDILFIDSSHIFASGNDVDVEYHVILPNLNPGVVVHCHDIFLPYQYPSWWGHRGYDEQDHLAQVLESGQWEVLLANHFIHANSSDRLHELFRSYHRGDYPGSFWMRKLA